MKTRSEPLPTSEECHSNRGTVHVEGGGRSTPTEPRCPPAIETINRRNQSQRPQRPTDRQTCPHSLKGRPPGKGTDGRERRKGADYREGRKVCCGLMTRTGGMAFMKGNNLSRSCGQVSRLEVAGMISLHFLSHFGMIKQTR